MMEPCNCHPLQGRKPRFVSRRQFWMEAGMGIGGLGLIDLLTRDQLLGAELPKRCVASTDLNSPFLPKPPHFKPKAKAVISLFMCGGVSHIDTFQYKPALDKYNRMPLEGHGEIVVRQGNPGPLMKSPFTFKRYGQSGAWVSEIFPRLSTIVDDLAFIHSAKGTSNDHTLSHLEWNTGNILVGYPSVGSWVTYGLGTVNQNLPAYVVLYDSRGGPYGGPQNWASGYLPAAYQGTVFRSQGDPVLDLSPPSEFTSIERERARLDQLAKLNEEHAERYLAFEVSWAKQRKILAVPKPFFPGQHFAINHNLVFVLMPFAAEFEEIYSTCIKPTLEKRIPRCLRADEIFHNKPIVEIIWKNINEALLVVADLSGRNPNVFYEVGMAHTLGKEVILLTQDLNDVPFDLRHLSVICYKWTPPGAERLKQALDATVVSVLQREVRRAVV